MNVILCYIWFMFYVIWVLGILKYLFQFYAHCMQYRFHRINIFNDRYFYKLPILCCVHLTPIEYLHDHLSYVLHVNQLYQCCYSLCYLYYQIHCDSHQHRLCINLSLNHSDVLLVDPKQITIFNCIRPHMQRMSMLVFNLLLIFRVWVKLKIRIACKMKWIQLTTKLMWLMIINNWYPYERMIQRKNMSISFVEIIKNAENKSFSSVFIYLS